MKFSFLVVCVIASLPFKIFAQKNDLPNFNRSLQLEGKSDTTANVSSGDFDGDGHLDIVLVKGRHWPITDRVLLGDGKGGIKRAYSLGKISDRSYTGGVGDFNGDGFPDIAISNDSPDKKLIYINDGKGNFAVKSEFGLPDWPTRNISIADINHDGLPDIILANRGDEKSVNYVCLNRGQGQFSSNCTPVAPYPATTIAPADINHDGIIDLVIPHRDGGQSYVYFGNSAFTFSDSRRVPFGPSDATIRVAAVRDINADNWPDIVTIDEKKGVSLYFGQKDQTFSAGIMIADSKVIPYALTLADLNNDKKVDILVGHIEAPSSVYFNDGTARNFKSISFGDSQGTVYGFAVGDYNEDGKPDIAAARSDAPNVLYFGD